MVVLRCECLLLMRILRVDTEPNSEDVLVLYPELIPILTPWSVFKLLVQTSRHASYMHVTAYTPA